MNFNIKDYSLIDEIGPEKIVIIKDPTINLNGVLVIDNSVYGIPAGGVRLAPDISLDEMIRLARAMSLKFCAYRLKVGGAKAGIWGNPLDKEKKNMLLTGFANAVETFIKNDVYYPGPDMGTDDRDLFKMFSVMGVPNLAPKPIGLTKNGIPVEELFTGYGVVNCLEVIYNNLDKFTLMQQDTNRKPKVILEGFGKVGAALAIALDELGFKLTGLSTINGAIYDDDGLSVKTLLELRQHYKDDLVNRFESINAIHLEKEKLFELSSEFQTDFIIPGARPDAINKLNVDKINAVAIVPAANIPYEKGVVDILNERKIIAFPDFIANAGEVLALLINKVAKNAAEIFDFIKSK
jgi:glutamate dehydrogenase (NAD(P)+)